MNDIEHLLLTNNGVIARSRHRHLAGRLDEEVRHGRLSAIHPGVYCRPDQTGLIETRILAAALWAGPDGVLTRRAAAKLTFMPKIAVPVITVAIPTTVRRARTGIRFERRRIPPELVLRRGPIAMTMPSLTAVDLADTRDGGAIIDEALRTKAATLERMWNAFELTPRRPGNAMRRKLLDESRHLPWSEPERETHRLLDEAGLTGWETNAPVLGYYVDVLFAQAMLVLEIDGWEIHRTREAFENDRRRRNELELAGYRVLNFTWRHLVDDPQWVIDCVLRGLAYGECSATLAR